MAISWPSTIPATLDTHQQSDVDVLLKTQTDAGPGKIRRKWTGVVTNVSGTSILTAEQALALIEFHRVDCKQGSLTFSFPDPMTKVLSVYRWDDVPKFTNLGPLAYQVTFQWKKVPGDA